MEKHNLVGLLSERDYTRKVILKGKQSKETTVRDIMSADVTTVGPLHTVEHCMRLMTAQRPSATSPSSTTVASSGWSLSAIWSTGSYPFKALPLTKWNAISEPNTRADQTATSLNLIRQRADPPGPPFSRPSPAAYFPANTFAISLAK
ncbi:MAG: hypothetical protein J6386_00080 [Candidatus Synoicihabitans palmerolidicus]|nr:hypothetical protein [Candidatus Synoicihabitans palmerolidicus]